MLVVTHEEVNTDYMKLMGTGKRKMVESVISHGEGGQYRLFQDSLLIEIVKILRPTV
jgi:hypothetical protein